MISQLHNIVLCYSTTLENVNEQYLTRIDYIGMGGWFNWRPYKNEIMDADNIRTIYCGYTPTKYSLPRNY